MFHRRCSHLPRPVRGTAGGAVELSKAMLDARRRDTFYRNTSYCFQYGRPCAYFQLCRSGGNPNVIENHFQRIAPHEELRDGASEDASWCFEIPTIRRRSHAPQDQKQTQTHALGPHRPGVRPEQDRQEHLVLKADDALFLATEPGPNALEVPTLITCWDDLLPGLRRKSPRASTSSRPSSSTHGG